MRRLAIWVSLITLPASFCHAQQSYKAAEIPAALKTGASAVIRDMDTKITMVGTENVLQQVKQVVTILNKGGDEHANLVLHYNKANTIKSVKGYMLDAQGNQIGKIGISDFIDQSAVSDFSLYEDYRLKYFSPAITSYPCTIVYEYEIRSKQNLIIPDWYPNPYPDLAVEQSNYTFAYSPDMKIRFKAYNYQGEAVEKEAEKLNTYTWAVKNVPAFKDEPYAPAADSYRTCVKIAPEQFSYYKNKGAFKNWNELGKWIYTDLVKPRQNLDPSTVAHMKSLVQGATSDREKAQRIYAYMQQKTRYISVQIGIGGFQPMLSTDVDRLGYGDCKALVSYMQSLLAAVDIPSIYCVVYAGRFKHNMDPEFASMDQGNHVILALPLGNDTTWLECTSQTLPFGFLGDFTDDRLVLACSEAGGKILRTPLLTTKMNNTKRTAVLKVEPTGNVTGRVTTLYKGAGYDTQDALINKPHAEQVKLLNRYYDIDNIGFNKITLSQEKTAEPVTTEKLEVQIAAYVPKSQQSAYLLPNAFNRMNSTRSVLNRKLPVNINRGYTEEDEIVYELPAGYEIEHKADDLEITGPFGSYMAKITKVGNELRYYRKFVLNEGKHSAQEYNTFADFMNQVATADRSKVILKVN